jgi:RecG-like helicase
VSTGEFTQADRWGGRPVARTIARAVPRARVVVSGVVYATAVTKDHGTPSYECWLDDGTGEIGLLFLGRQQVAGIVVGTRCTVEGTARLEGGKLVLWNPLYRIGSAGD